MERLKPRQMKTSKELQDLYIDAVMHNYKQKEQRQMQKMGVLVNVYSKKLEKFCEYVEENIYKDNTTFAYIIKYFKVPKKYQNKEDAEKYLLSKKDPKYYKPIIKKTQKETHRRIESYFEKYRVELNNILEFNNSLTE